MAWPGKAWRGLAGRGKAVLLTKHFWKGQNMTPMEATLETDRIVTEAMRIELQRLEENGKLDPKEVVDAARDTISPLHDYFEWDDDKAADAYRLEQARTLIRRVKIVVVEAEREYRTVRYVRDPEMEQDETGYVSVLTVRRQDRAESILGSELRRSIGQLSRSAGIARSLHKKLPDGFADEIDGIADKVRSLADQIE